MQGLDTVESLSTGARGSISLLLKVLPKLGLLYDVDKPSTIPTVGITKNRAFGALILLNISSIVEITNSRAFGTLILVKYFQYCGNNQKQGFWCINLGKIFLVCTVGMTKSRAFGALILLNISSIVEITNSRAFGTLILVKYFQYCGNNQKWGFWCTNLGNICLVLQE